MLRTSFFSFSFSFIKEKEDFFNEFLRIKFKNIKYLIFFYWISRKSIRFSNSFSFSKEIINLSKRTDPSSANSIFEIKGLKTTIILLIYEEIMKKRLDFMDFWHGLQTQIILSKWEFRVKSENSWRIRDKNDIFQQFLHKKHFFNFFTKKILIFLL